MSKQFNKIYFILFSGMLLLLACAKETSFETGNLYGTAQGTLKDSVGNCQGVTINGIYAVDTVLTDSNYVSVIATITTPGLYKIYTDTVNGFWFRDSAYVLTTGTKTFKLKGYGKPILPIASNFTVFFNTSYCLFSITPTGTGGGSSGGGGTGVTAPSGDYFPITTNSNWTYDNTLLADTVRYTCTNINGTAGGKTYRLFVTTQSDSLLYRKDSLQGNYYQYGAFFDSSTVFEYKFLDDKLPLNSSWETQEFQAISMGVTYTLKVRFTIDAKNASYSINGNNIDSVFKIRQDVLQKQTGGLFSILSAYTQYAYYAKKIGLVWSDYPNYTPAFSEKIRKWKIY